MTGFDDFYQKIASDVGYISIHEQFKFHAQLS